MHPAGLRAGMVLHDSWNTSGILFAGLWLLRFLLQHARHKPCRSSLQQKAW